ncbi:monovalent cation/H(+) antiporter subunit G [Corynebacterium sp. UMB2355A]|uniref:monovalent cation/H(+) antiporter subunit G n=1 Tax=Corynebacterium sp. UMB2355A TaxID=3081222 RepID=UPI0029FF1C40|nr:monovalent cation/H(+) antiporter subunit G [Corynebacterium sp. UMB2355A]WPJ93598.1 monovalent cation/H(+) antiporter subunit G [Corynebacterium sp. UMB2355A]
MTLAFFLDAASLVFILPGAFMVFSAAIGTARFQSTMARIHAITKPQTTGLVLMIIGTIIRLSNGQAGGAAGTHELHDIGVILILLIFALMTNPVTAQRLGRVARREGLYGNPDTLSRNDRPAAYHPKRVDPTKK